jgi:hypothetical protein
MTIYFATSTKGPFWTTRIAHKRLTSSKVEISEYDGTESQALLILAIGIVSGCPKGSTVTFYCKSNGLRDSFEKGWVEAWAEKGFTRKPAQHRERWAKLYALLQERSISIKFANLPEQEEKILTNALNGKRAEILTPGDPVENPWADHSSDINDAIDRAIKRNR